MTRLRWATVVLVVALVGVVEFLSDTLLDPYLPYQGDTLLVMLIVAIGAVGFSRIAFQRIDRLSVDLRARNVELETRDAALRALQETSVAISTLTDLEPILGLVVKTARDLLNADVAFIVTVAPVAGTRLRARSGPAELFAPEAAGGGSGSTAGRRQKGGDPAAFVRGDRVRVTEGVPVRRGDRIIGTLAVGSTGERHSDAADLETLQALADQAAVAIENDRLHRELRVMAVQDERNRIARELHDGLAQVLGYVNTKSQAATELLAAGRVPEARAQIEELAAAARSIYVDVREAILGLSSPVEPAGGLVAAIRDYAERFAEASKLAVHVDAQPDAGSALEPEVEDDLFRSVREALTNVRKHAEAQRVTIRVRREDEAVTVEIEDDGRGFDPDRVGAAGSDWPHHGLAGMRERAAAAGGTVEWRRAGPRGTLVRLSVPCGPRAVVGTAAR